MISDLEKTENKKAPIGAFLFRPVHTYQKQTKVQGKQYKQNAEKGIHG